MTPLTLYHSPTLRSSRVLWLIYELELPVNVKIIDLMADPGATHTPEFLAMNPHGTLPRLLDQDAIIFESTSALLYLLEQYGEGRLAPPATDAAARATFLQHIYDGESNYTRDLVDVFWNTIGLAVDKRRPQIAERGLTVALAAFDVLEKELEGKHYLVNDEFSAADISVGFGCADLRNLQLDDGKRYPNVRAYTGRVMSRPAAIKAFAPHST